MTIGAGLGLLYGFDLAIVTDGIVLPLWLRAVGFLMRPPFVDISMMGLFA